MDWATFFSENSQSLFTLFGVFLGSGITLLISYINNRFQANERDKDRDEQRREAKIQLALELTRNDVISINNAISAALKRLNLLTLTISKMTIMTVPPADVVKEVTSMIYDTEGEFKTLSDVIETPRMLASLFGDEFNLEFENFEAIYIDVQRTLVKQISAGNWDYAEYKEQHTKGLIKSAGKLHRMLNEILISLRD